MRVCVFVCFIKPFCVLEQASSLSLLSVDYCSVFTVFLFFFLICNCTCCCCCSFISDSLFLVTVTFIPDDFIEFCDNFLQLMILLFSAGEKRCESDGHSTKWC